MISYAGSSALAKQIGTGRAPADIFISADLDWMDYVQKAKLIKDDTRFNLLGNRLVLIAPKASTVELKIGKDFPLAAALGDGHLAMANVKAVPAGKYGSAALQKLGVWSAVESKVAQADNVARPRWPLSLRARHRLASSMRRTRPRNRKSRLSTSSLKTHIRRSSIRSPLSLRPKMATAAKAFIDYLKSPDAQAFFTKQGFTILK